MTIPTGWNLQCMPEAHCKIELNLKISLRRMDELSEGFEPEEMEQKWLWYVTEKVLYLHRSWTGYCIYEVHFDEQQDGSCIAIYALVNRDPSQYTNTKNTEDKKMLKQFIVNGYY